MARFASIGDLHARLGFPTPYGMVEYENNFLTKVDWLINFLTEQNIKHLVIPGDVFDIKTPSKYNLTIINKFIEFFERFKSAGITLLTIPGNHDLPFATMDSYKDSIYWHFVSLGYLTDISIEPYFLTNDDNIDEVVFYGVGYTSSTSDLLSQLSDFDSDASEEIDEPYAVAVVHEHLLPNGEALPFDVNFINYSDIVSAAKGLDCVIAGHLHKGYPIYSNNNFHIVNSWSFSRLARDYYNVNDQHIPEVVIHDTSQAPISYPIPHKPFNELFLETRDSVLANSSQFDSVLSKIENDISSDSVVGNTLGLNNLSSKARELVDFYLEDL